MSDRQVLITGIGLATPLGDTLEAFGAALFEGVAPFGIVRTRHASPLPGARVASDPSVGLSRAELQLGDRSVHLALQASTRALADAGWPAGSAVPQGCGVFVGCGSGPTEALQLAYATLEQSGRMAGLTLLRCLPGGAAGAIAIRHGLRGPAQTYANACASSATALGEALRAIRHGYIDMALVGGTEAPFGDTTLRAWEALRVLAPAGDDPGSACRPFDTHRRGLVLGEGAAFFVLEAAEVARDRQARVHARLAGYGASGDGRHLTEPDPTGQVLAMQAAIRDAGLAPWQIGCVNAHGTGTSVGDQAEASAIASVFSPDPGGPCVTSTKAAHGHLLGAAGAIELAASVLSLKAGRVPATRNLLHPDPLCPLRLVHGQPARLPPGSAVLSNSFAFGGSNACLVVTSAQA